MKSMKKIPPEQKLCPECETGRDSYKLDKHSSFCPYIICHDGETCTMFKKISGREKMNVNKLYRLAYTDLMTGIYNRNAFEEYLNNIKKNPDLIDGLYVLIVDINNLKIINDIYGHSAGDVAIKTVAQSMQNTFGGNGVVFRIGGDEFISFAKNTYLDVVFFKKEIEKKNKKLGFDLSVAVGQCQYNKGYHISIDDFITSCEREMYRDKNCGDEN